MQTFRSNWTNQHEQIVMHSGRTDLSKHQTFRELIPEEEETI